VRGEYVRACLAPERPYQLPLSVFETEVNFVPTDVAKAVTAVTRAAPIRASMMAYSSIVAPSSPAKSRLIIGVSFGACVMEPGDIRCIDREQRLRCKVTYKMS
jgi:hypothetical protein